MSQESYMDSYLNTPESLKLVEKAEEIAKHLDHKLIEHQGGDVDVFDVSVVNDIDDPYLLVKVLRPHHVHHKNHDFLKELEKDGVYKSIRVKVEKETTH